MSVKTLVVIAAVSAANTGLHAQTVGLQSTYRLVVDLVSGSGATYSPVDSAPDRSASIWLLALALVPILALRLKGGASAALKRHGMLAVAILMASSGKVAAQVLPSSDDATVTGGAGPYPYLDGEIVPANGFGTFTDTDTVDHGTATVSITSLPDPAIYASAYNSSASGILTYKFEALWTGPGPVPAGLVAVDFSVSGGISGGPITPGGEQALFVAQANGVVSEPDVSTLIYDSAGHDQSFSYSDQTLDVLPNVANPVMLDLQLYDIGLQSASGYVDPVITVDPLTPDAADYTIIFSGNMPVAASAADGVSSASLLAASLAALAAVASVVDQKRRVPGAR